MSSSSSNSPRHPRLAKLATDQLTRERARQCERPIAPTDDDDAAAINAIAQAIGANAARQRRRRVFVGVGGLAGVLAAAAAVIIVVMTPPRTQTTTATVSSASSMTGVARALGVGVVILREGREVALVDQSAGGTNNSNSNRNSNSNSNLLTRGDRVLAGVHGKVALDLSTGTRVVLERGTDFSVTELGEVQRFMLRTGTMQADVAKLEAGQRFLVHTSDNTEIEVRGTSFRVEAVVGSAGGGDSPSAQQQEPQARRCAESATRVFVSEGTVVVRSARRGEDRVTAGASWPPGCIAAAAAATAAGAMVSHPTPTSFLGSSSVSEAHPSAASAPHLSVAAPPRAAHALVPSNGATSSSSSSSSPAFASASPSTSASGSSELAEQNRLYGEASTLRRRGATREAIATYERFLARYPSSQLAESAMVERMRLLALVGGDRTQGSTAAREYLARWPRGFARQEAIEIVQGTPP